MENSKLHLSRDKSQLMIFRTRSPNTTVYNAMIGIDFADLEHVLRIQLFTMP